MARQVATRWIGSSAVVRAAGGSFSVASVSPVQLGEQTTVAYRVDLAPAGYVLLSADDRLSPVLAFSTQGRLDLDSVGQNALRALIARDAVAGRAALKLASGNGTAAARVRAAMDRHHAQWLVLASEATVAAAGASAVPAVGASSVLVQPMVAAHWSQWNHFNELFPSDPQPGTGYDGRAPAGCMAVAGGEIAHFYAWPPYGANGHTDDDTNPANLISGSFGSKFDEPLNWAATQTQYDPWVDEPAAAVSAVSAALYKIGIAVNLDFGSYQYGGSSASLQALSRGLSRSFFFERGTYMTRAGNEASFDASLRRDVLAGRPVACAIPGHAVVVDGLSNEGGVDYFHLNYGFGGINDGWYLPSALPEGGLDSAIFGQRPAFIPLLSRAGFVTNTSGAVTLDWSMAAARLGDVSRFRVREGSYVAAAFADSCDSAQNWTDYSGGWVVEAAGFNGGACLRKSGEVGDFSLALRDPFIASASTRLQFNYKVVLAQDHVYLDISTDRGRTWQNLRHLTNTGMDTTWRWCNADLSAYAGREVMLRFQYSFKSGSFYGSNGGVWIDDVVVTNSQQMRWTVLSDTISAGSTQYAVGVRLSGTQHFEVQACNGSTWSAAAPFVTVTVELDEAEDADGDTLSNGWESSYFGSATGGVANVDSDGDGASNAAEFAAGTHPLNAGSVLAVTGTSSEAGAPSVSWSSVAGKTYSVWRAESPAGTYTAIASHLPSTAPVNTFADADAANLATAFYRISVD